MSSNDEIISLANQVKGFVPTAADRPPTYFLSLAPATSNSYPKKKNSVAEGATTAPVAASETAAETAALEATKQRRSSSLSSTASTGPGLRILKLGPVHWGEHLDDHKSDWHEVAIE